MRGDNLDDRLSRIQTEWTRLLSPVDGAEKDLLLRYYGAAFRYLLAVVKDAAAAEELAQEFAIRFLAGHYRKVDRQRGRFRDFIKTCLRNLVHDHFRKHQKDKERLPADPKGLDPATPSNAEGDDTFDTGWRDEVMARTWDALGCYEAETGKPYCAVLRLKTEEPAARSEELAMRLREALNKSFRPGAVRKTLQRAREAFADLLLDEVGRTLPSADRDHLEEELVELQLIDYCRKALDRRFPPA